jgi:hypothetical protein
MNHAARPPSGRRWLRGQHRQQRVDRAAGSSPGKKIGVSARLAMKC